MNRAWVATGSVAVLLLVQSLWAAPHGALVPPDADCTESQDSIVVQQPSISRFKALVEGLSNFFRFNREDEQRRTNQEFIDHIKVSARVARGFMNEMTAMMEIGDQDELQNMLKDHPDLLDTLGKHTAIMELYAMDSGVWEGYSIEQHTLRVLEELENQVGYWDLDSLDIRSSWDVKRLMRHTLALHDIGKGLSVLGGNKSLQERFNGAVAAQTLRHLGFSKKEIRLARALIDNNSIGDMLMNRISVAQAYEKFQQVAREIGEPVSVVFRLQTLYYTADAGSYPSLHRSVFKDHNDGIVPKSPLFADLVKLVVEDKNNLKPPKPLPKPPPVSSPSPTLGVENLVPSTY